jgi:hypothetical protein
MQIRKWIAEKILRVPYTYYLDVSGLRHSYDPDTGIMTTDVEAKEMTQQEWLVRSLSPTDKEAG